MPAVFGSLAREIYTKLVEVWEWFMCDSDVIAFCDSNSAWRLCDSSNKFNGWPWTFELMSQDFQYLMLWIPEGSSIINTGSLKKRAGGGISAKWYYFLYVSQQFPVSSAKSAFSFIMNLAKFYYTAWLLYISRKFWNEMFGECHK